MSVETKVAASTLYQILSSPRALYYSLNEQNCPKSKLDDLGASTSRMRINSLPIAIVMAPRTGSSIRSKQFCFLFADQRVESAEC